MTTEQHIITDVEEQVRLEKLEELKVAVANQIDFPDEDNSDYVFSDVASSNEGYNDRMQYTCFRKYFAIGLKASHESLIRITERAKSVRSVRSKSSAILNLENVNGHTRSSTSSTRITMRMENRIYIPLPTKKVIPEKVKAQLSNVQH